MGKHEVLFMRIDEILYYVWDPIGVNGSNIPETRDEYSGYTQAIYKKVLEGNSEHTANLLDEFITNNMGMESQLSRCKEVA